MATGLCYRGYKLLAFAIESTLYEGEGVYILIGVTEKRGEAVNILSGVMEKQHASKFNTIVWVLHLLLAGIV